MDLTYCKSQRRKARTALRNYLVALKSEIRNDYGVVLPIESQLKNMNSAKFDEWFASVVNVFLENKEIDLTLTELVDEYLCSLNNVAIAEATTNDVYY